MNKHKKFVRIVCMVIVIIMIATLVAPLIFSVSAESLKDKLDRLTSEVASLDKEIKSTESTKKSAERTRNLYSQKAEVQKQQIEALAQQIAEQEAALAIKQEEIANKILELENTRALFKDRLCAIYMSQDRSGISTILGAKDYTEFLRVSENLKQIAKHDTELMNLLATQQAELEQMATEIQGMLDNLAAQKQESEQLKAQYEESMRKAAADAKAAAELEQKQKQDRQQTEEERKQAEREWIAWVSKDTQGGDFVGGVFMWPLPGKYNLSSGFGDRADNHRGIDIPAAAGTPIYAAAAGTVSTAAHYSYGTCVKISHGGGVVSVYGHMSARAAGITDGVVVAKGDLVGYVGSTGVSTGNHLHFEIDENGTPVNPMKYVTK